MNDTGVFDELDRRIARALLTIGAVSIRPRAPFTWASGLKAPVYCDNRLTLGHPSVRSMLTQGFRAFMDRERLSPEAIVGTATGGIAHAAWLAGDMQLPMAYVRPDYKAHGKGNRVEGGLDKDKAVVVVEDLVSTGRSSWRAVTAIRESAQARVLAMVAIFTYGFPGVLERFRAEGIAAGALCDFSTLLSVAVEERYLSERDLEVLLHWRRDPRGWSAAR